MAKGCQKRKKASNLSFAILFVSVCSPSTILLRSNPFVILSGFSALVTEMEDTRGEARDGIGWIVATFFLTGIIAGTGVLALPSAMLGAGLLFFFMSVGWLVRHRVGRLFRHNFFQWQREVTGKFSCGSDHLFVNIRGF